FSFQAEDGIRDFHVTGVQTCALPISCGRPRIRGGRSPGVFGRSNSPRKFTGPPGLSPTVQGTDRIGRTPGTPAPSAWPRRHLAEIGRASCRERLQIHRVAVLLQTKSE